jgi:alpha-galactosidase
MQSISPRSLFAFLLPCAIAIAPIQAAEETNAPTVSATNAPAPTEADILTPKPPATPRITGPKIFGVRPGKPFLFKVTATGDRPMTFSVKNLPSGLTLDTKTGMITGSVQEKGTTTVTLHAKNAQGKASRSFRIVCGDKISLTPALGWNSWNRFGGHVKGEDVRGAADAMVSSGLIDHGWSYINVDDCWEAGRDTNGMIQSNEKFPDMKGMSDYIHSKGLKFGIYSSPGPKTCAGYTASYQYEDKDAEQYGKWDVDYVKYDWCSYGGVANKIRAEKYASRLPAGDGAKFKAIVDEKVALDAIRGKNRTDAQNARLKELNKQWNDLIAKVKPEEKAVIDLAIVQEPYAVFRKSLDKVNRDIIFSYCQYGMGKVWEWGEKLGGNSWRTTGDINATWKSISTIGFNQNALEKYAGPGHWNDPDMLEIGNGHLTADEQFTHMSLWALLSSPLLIGCDMTKMSPFSVSLLSNDEVLDVNQDPLGKPAGRIALNGDAQVWARDLEDGSKAAGLFNLGPQPAKVAVTWADLGIKGPQMVRDLWRQKNLGSRSGNFEATVPSHGVVLVKITPEAK